MKAPLISNGNIINSSSSMYDRNDGNDMLDVGYIIDELKKYYTSPFSYHNEALAGGLEYLGIRHKLLIIAEKEGNNGIIQESSIDKENLISSQLNLIQTLLVVATLIFSVLLSMATNSPGVSIDSLNFFGNTGIYIINIIYRILVTSIILGTIYLITILLFSYTVLTIWIQNNISRIKFLKEFPPIKIIGLCAVLLLAIIFVIPVSLALSATPIDAFISLLFIFTIMPVLCYFIPMNNSNCREWQKSDVMSLISKLEQSIRKP